MNDVRDYIKYYKNYTFIEEKFNEVDNVVLSMLSYINFTGIVPSIDNGCISINNACNLYWEKYSKEENNMNILAVRNAGYILKLIGDSKRYQDILLYNYSYIVDDNTQFGALCCKLLDGTIYVSYEGTDSLISGWEEDFKLSYTFPTLSQKYAIEYLNKVIKFSDKKIILGGHSKGGNLAIVSSMYCKKSINKKILAIYNNDGPGLRKSEFESKNYSDILSRLKTFIPEDSVIGLVLNHDRNYIVVKSSAKGIFQHDAVTWNCYGGHFVKTSLSKNSSKFEISISSWMNKYTDLEKEKFTVSLFDIFRKSNITDLRELKEYKLKSIIKLIKETSDMEESTRDMIIDFIKIILREE